MGLKLTIIERLNVVLPSIEERTALKARTSVDWLVFASRARRERFVAVKGGALAVLLPLIGCSGADGSEPSEIVSSRYVISSSIITTDTTQPLLFFVDDLSAPGRVDGAVGVETRESGFVADGGISGRFLHVSYDTPRVERFDVVEGSPVSAGVLDFSATGAQQASAALTVRRDLAFIFPSGAPAVVVIDPEAMRVVTAVELPELYREDFPTAFFGSPVLRGDKLYAPYRYQNLDADAALAETVLVELDTDTLEVRVLRDERCGFTSVDLAPSGDIYLSTAQQGASFHLVGRPLMPEPCLLRIPEGSDEIDSDFILRHSGWTGGRPANDLVVIADDAAYVIAAYTERLQIDETTVRSDITFADAWRWWRVDPRSADSGVELSERDWTTGRYETLRLGEQRLTFEYLDSESLSSSTLVSMSRDGFIAGLTVPGFIGGVADLAE